MRFTISMHEIDLKALKAPLAATLREGCEFFKVPCIGLVKVERLLRSTA